MLPHHHPPWMMHYISLPPMGTTAAAWMLLQGITFSEDTPPDDNENGLCYLNTVTPLTWD